MRSLWGRLAFGLSVSLLLFFVIQWWVSDRALHELTDEFVISRLEHDAENILGALRKSERGETELNPHRVSGIYHQPFSGHYYIVQVGDEIFFSRSLWDFDLAFPPADGGRTYVEGPDGQHLLVVSESYVKLGQVVRIAVAEDMAPLNENLAEFLAWYAGLAFVMILVMIAVQGLLVRTSLRPLDQVQDEMERMERGEMLRLSEDVPSEILPLVQKFNSLLEVMKGQLERSRSAMGNLAHALKTPLTVLSRLSDDEELDRSPVLKRELAQQVEMIRQLTDRQLKRARLAGAGAPGGHFVPAEEFPPLIHTLERIYAEKNIDIALSLPAQSVFCVDREDMMELFGNLLDNACKWANSQVSLSVEPGDDLVVCVADDGPGCAPEYRQQLSRRGVRLDESTTGHGLGLAIVSEIIKHYGGELYFGESTQLGGFEVRVHLPLHPSLG